MHFVRMHKAIALMISFYYLIGIWHRGDKPTAKEIKMKLFYSIYPSLFIVSLVVGAVGNVNEDKNIFLTEIAITVGVFSVKLSLLIWKQDTILDLMNRVCVFEIQNGDDVSHFNDKTKGFIKFVIVFVTGAVIDGGSAVAVLPFLGNEKILFLEIGFPLDWRNNEIAFWIASIFILTQFVLIYGAVFFTIIIWYLLLNCSLRFEVLGNDLKRMGRITEARKGKISDKRKQYIFLQDLKMAIDAQLHLTALTNELGSFLSDLFFIQFGTSGLCICGSIYCLAFDIAHNLLERLIYLILFLYFISELFMITYFGNEITLTSDRLFYCLFESDWCDQQQSTKKCVIIFGEYLKQPLQLLVGKLYPLTLETFTRILKSAFSMFNILKSFQQ